MNNLQLKNWSFILLLNILTFTTVFAQSPWTQKKGEAYTQFGFSTIPNYTSLFGDPNFDTERVLTDNTFQLYGEYGVSDKTTLILNVPFKNIAAAELTNPGDANNAITIEETVNALGNVTAGVRHNFYKNKWLVSGQLDIELNTGTYQEGSGIRTGYDSFTLRPTISAGRGFDQFYIQAFMGLDLRTNNYSTNFKAGGEAGAKVFDRIWIIGFLDVVQSLEDGDFVPPAENILTGLYVNNQEYVGYGLKAIVEATPKFGVMAGFGGVFADANNNVPREAALNFGLYYKIGKK